ncbi:hypothetical protein PF004_g14007 [Phytophthora fragariae]|nr:hypothetical protein PF004_g14007 [Phytophthora fragariae]
MWGWGCLLWGWGCLLWRGGGATPHTGVAPARPSKTATKKSRCRCPRLAQKAKAKANAYVKFKQAHALGRFTVLAEQKGDGQN